MKTLLFSALFLGVLPSQAMAAVTVLGVELDGQKVTIPICPANTDKAKVMCWVDKPFAYKAVTQLGMIHLPNPASRPSWAVNAVFNAVAKRGVIQELKAEVFGASSREVIASSISSRFGKPTNSATIQSGLYLDTWVKPEIFIEMICQENCVVNFRSAVAQKEYEAEMQSRKKVDAARPIAP